MQAADTEVRALLHCHNCSCAAADVLCAVIHQHEFINYINSFFFCMAQYKLQHLPEVPGNPDSNQESPSLWILCKTKDNEHREESVRIIFSHIPIHFFVFYLQVLEQRKRLVEMFNAFLESRKEWIEEQENYKRTILDEDYEEAEFELKEATLTETINITEEPYKDEYAL